MAYFGTLKKVLKSQRNNNDDACFSFFFYFFFFVVGSIGVDSRCELTQKHDPLKVERWMMRWGGGRCQWWWWW